MHRRWGFDQPEDNWQKTKASINAVLAENPLAPFVFHSMAFGSEPIGKIVLHPPDGHLVVTGATGDKVFNGSHDKFIKEMRAWKSDLSQYGIPIAISEDWDRRDGDNALIKPQGAGVALNDFGKQIQDASDVLQLHRMCARLLVSRHVFDSVSYAVLQGLPQGATCECSVG